MNSFLLDVYNSPVLISFILTSLWIYVKILVDNWDLKYFQVDYNGCVVKNEWYRIFSFPLYHSSIIHLLLNITALWSLRFSEKLYGSFFLFKYSVVLAIFESLSTLGVIHWVLKYSRLRISPQHPISNASIYGFTSIILGWLGYMSIDLVLRNINVNVMFYVFGFIPTPIIIAPIVVMLISQCVLPKSHSISHAGGLVGGYLLAFGVLKILPDTFWTVCILFDVAVVITYYYVKSTLNSESITQRPRLDTTGDTFEVVSYDNNATTVLAIESQARDSDQENVPLLTWDSAQSGRDGHDRSEIV